MRNKIVIFLSILFASTLEVEASSQESLLAYPESRLVAGVVNPRQAETAAELTDGLYGAPASGARKAFTLVFEFNDVVSPERVVVHLPTTGADELAGELELLSSLVSPESGFQLLRKFAVSTKQQQKHNFEPVGTRWLMVRFTPVDDPPQTGISEIEVLGNKGPPASAYLFNESPAAALQVLDAIGNSLDVSISQAEQDLFEDAADGSLDRWTLAEAALLASGVVDEGERLDLIRQIDRLEEAFRSVTDVAGDPFETGQTLLEWLHAGPMDAGYVSKQTDVSTVLLDNTFNCVSSAVLYSILGNRMGLDIRGVEVPDHAFAILYSGSDYADVETTTPQGFNPTRNKEAIEAFQAMTGFSYIPDRRPDKRREISPLKLVSFIYYNHGVDRTNEGDYHGALLANFRALSLDRDSKSAVKNALSALANWSVSLLDNEDYAEALEIVRLGLMLAPKDRTLNHNHRVIWQRRLDKASEELPLEDFVALVDDAHRELPGAGFDRQQGLNFIKQAEAMAARGEWRSAIDSIGEALPRVNEASAKELVQNRLNLVLRWSNGEIEARRWEAALDALSYGYELMPENTKIGQNIAYILQEWSEAMYRESGEAAAEEVVALVAGRFPEVRGVKRASRSFAIRRIQELQGQGRYADALDLIEDYRYLIGNDRDFDTLVRSVFDTQANVYLQQGNWDGALSIYTSASRSYPDNKQIKRNLTATWHQWADSYMKARQWPEALNVYDKAHARMPEERSFRKNMSFIGQEWLKSQDPRAESTRELIDYLYERLGEENKTSSLVSSYYLRQIDNLQKSRAFEESLEVAQGGASAIRDENEALKVRRYAWDNWAQHYAKSKEWQQAVDVYRDGIEALPGDSRLTNNAVATWHDWAKTYMDQKDWDSAIEVYTRGLERMPEAYLFKNNIDYCEQQRGG